MGIKGCIDCGGPLSKEDLYVFSRSTMRDPWCNECVKKEDAKILEERPPDAPQGFFSSLPRYLE